MSKEEFLKIQKCVLKVNIHCEGCKQKVKKILQKMDGVFTTEIDSEQGKVTVSGTVDSSVLIKKLAKSGKHAELWGAPKSNNQNHMPNHLKNTQIDNGKTGGANNKPQKGGNNQPKAGGGGGGPNPQQLQLQLQQQLQQMKGFQDLKLPPQFKLPPNQNQKAAKFNLPEEEEDDFTDDELDDEFDEDDFEDDEFDDDDDDEIEDPLPKHPINKMKLPPNPNPMMLNAMNMMNAQKGGAPVKGGPGGGPVPIQVHGMGKKGGGGGPVPNQNQGGGGNKNNGGNNGGGGNNNKNNGNIGNGGKKSGNMMEASQAMNKGFPNINMGAGGGGGNMSMPMPSSNMPMPQMGAAKGNMPPVQGLPTTPDMSAGYFRGAGPEAMHGNPFQQQQQQQQQQQYMAAVMNQQRAMGNERFQPMMYAPPPPAVNYMYPPPQYPYPYPPPPHDPYSNYFSDDNTSSCNVM
ncbi:heavy metal-associated isoprenylated plant protein 33 [Senna tora]|uniref:Heavy metal-associated isoprenylated plant protein 33 n=1 Tax=Senna tora TaxID=362788 RepID=A0A835CBI5_9FABA|nr:heavy metal-associated isoprenylated plant protein 33 [Senna tora]